MRRACWKYTWCNAGLDGELAVLVDAFCWLVAAGAGALTGAPAYPPHLTDHLLIQEGTLRVLARMCCTACVGCCARVWDALHGPWRSGSKVAACIRRQLSRPLSILASCVLCLRLSQLWGMQQQCCACVWAVMPCLSAVHWLSHPSGVCFLATPPSFDSSHARTLLLLLLMLRGRDKPIDDAARCAFWSVGRI